MNKQFFINTRNKFFEQMEDNSVAVFFSGYFRRDTNDQLAYPFSVDRNFYYLTGIDKDNMQLLLWKCKGKCVSQLFIPPVDEYYEKWQARMMRTNEAAEISGVDQILYTYQFEGEFAKKMFAPAVTENVYIFSNIADMHEPLTVSQAFAQRVSLLYPSVRILNSLPLLIPMRNSKYPDEIELIDKAVKLAGEAFCYTAQNFKPGMYEYQAASLYAHYLTMRGSRPRFRSVVAGAKNATVLHYNEGKYQCQSGDMLLMDVGAMCDWYVSDITRTFPVNGKFTPKQAEVYDIVYDALNIALGTIRTGISEDVVQAAVKKHYAKALKTIGLITDDADVAKYYFHGSGHPIGLDLHDYRNSDKLITNNCVHTVEPGLYIAEWGMGIRIEDNVVVTDTGIINLSDNVPKTRADVENLMR